MLNAIKTKAATNLNKIAVRVFEAVPPKPAAIEAFRKNEFEFMTRKFQQACEVHSEFGWVSLATCIAFGKKAAQTTAITGLVISGMHVFDYFNVKHHANKQKTLETI